MPGLLRRNVHCTSMPAFRRGVDPDPETCVPCSAPPEDLAICSFAETFAPRVVQHILGGILNMAPSVAWSHTLAIRCGSGMVAKRVRPKVLAWLHGTAEGAPSKPSRGCTSFPTAGYYQRHYGAL